MTSAVTGAHVSTFLSPIVPWCLLALRSCGYGIPLSPSLGYENLLTSPARAGCRVVLVVWDKVREHGRAGVERPGLNAARFPATNPMNTAMNPRGGNPFLTLPESCFTYKDIFMSFFSPSVVLRPLGMWDKSQQWSPTRFPSPT
jgi:hypothetical protein